MPLARRLTLRDAVAIGLGSMIGAGVFSVWTPALDAAGSGLLVALAIAALVAYCNATSSAQLAAVHPVAGGTYAYARAEIGPWWGFIAGWCFVIGKIASCAAMAGGCSGVQSGTSFCCPITLKYQFRCACARWEAIRSTCSSRMSLAEIKSAITLFAQLLKVKKRVKNAFIAAVY